MMRTDAQLLRAARRDADAFRELYERYAERIHSYHARRCREADAAYELSAETFAQAWLARARFRDEAGGSAGGGGFCVAPPRPALGGGQRTPPRGGRGGGAG